MWEGGADTFINKGVNGRWREVLSVQDSLDYERLALEKLGLVPLLDLDLRLGEGSGAVAAVPVVRSAVALLRDVALLSELAPGDPV